MGILLTRINPTKFRMGDDLRAVITIEGEEYRRPMMELLDDFDAVVGYLAGKETDRVWAIGKDFREFVKRNFPNQRIELKIGE